MAKVHQLERLHICQKGFLGPHKGDDSQSNWFCVPCMGFEETSAHTMYEEERMVAKGELRNEEKPDYSALLYY